MVVRLSSSAIISSRLVFSPSGIEERGIKVTVMIIISHIIEPVDPGPFV
jgi:hypothetical protein